MKKPAVFFLSSFAVLMAALAVFCFHRPAFCEEEPVLANVEDLVARPEAYHGKFIRTMGYVTLSLSGDAIYSSEADASDPKKGIWLELKDEELKKYRANFDGKQCILEGTFNAKNRGHFDHWAGAVEKISRFDSME